MMCVVSLDAVYTHGRAGETATGRGVPMARKPKAPDVLTMTKTAMLDGMKQLAKDCPVEVEGGVGKTWGSAK